MKTDIITLDYDLDKITFNEVKDIVGQIIEVFDKVYIRKSASRQGYHVKIYLDRPIDTIESFYFREIYKDDPNRLQLDISRYFAGCDILSLLYDEKNGVKAGRWKNAENFKAIFDKR